MCLCAPHSCLVPTEVRRAPWIPWNGVRKAVSQYVGAENYRWVLCRAARAPNHWAFSPTSYRPHFQLHHVTNAISTTSSFILPGILTSENVKAWGKNFGFSQCNLSQCLALLTYKSIIHRSWPGSLRCHQLQVQLEAWELGASVCRSSFGLIFIKLWLGIFVSSSTFMDRNHMWK